MSVGHEISTETRMDETDINLRAYLEDLSPKHLAKYNPDWIDEEVVAWDSNLRSDGDLMLVYCDRNVDVRDFIPALNAKNTLGPLDRPRAVRPGGNNSHVGLASSRFDNAAPRKRNVLAKDGFVADEGCIP